MLESGLRFAFAFLPAGVAVLIGLVIAVQRRRVLPEVSTPAIWGLGLQLLAILVSASVNLVPALFLGSGVDTALTVSVVIGILTVLLTVISWVLILTALFRRLPARSEAPTTATPAQPSPAVPRRVGPTPPADDAPTGRHALLDERGQQVVAQEGVRLYPQAAAIAAGRGGEGSGPFPADGSRVEEMPTEAVPVVGRASTGPDVQVAERAGDEAAAEDRGAEERAVDGPGADEPGADESGVEADPGPAGVDEAAVGGTPTGPAREPAASSPAAPAAASPAASAVPATAAPAAAAPVASRPAADAPTTPDEGPAGVDEAAIGGTPVEPTAAATDDDASTETLSGLATAASVPGLDPAADDPALDDPALEEPGGEAVHPAEATGEATAAEDAPPADPSPVSVDEGAVGGVPTGASGPDTPPRVTAPGSHPAPASHPGPGSALRPATPVPASDSTAPGTTAPDTTADDVAPTPGTTASTAFTTPAGAPTDAPRTSSPAGSDLFAPARSTTTSDDPSAASVPGWFEPVTDGRADAEEPAVESRNGHATER
ncbi:hypothetical protein [Actinomycetospora atypica]|uniref:Uncharacterized protein n=1 Tax=Actinomycetospora atypica TaxID=1290095 RepID=A0ABV9YLJ3_9PSEU